MPLKAGTRLGPYQIESPIGAGGMGEVYKARDTRLDRIVAIKVLNAAMAGDPAFRDRFEREARAISSLDHPHICALYDVGQEPAEQPPVHFLVMQYLEGETLADRIARAARPKSDTSGVPSGMSAVSMARGPISIEHTLKYAIQIAAALDAAHRRGIVHRDLKPGNVFLTRSGGPSSPPVVKLLDFGLAKLRAEPAAGSLTLAQTMTAPLTGEGSLLGTLQYMSPEQLHGSDVDARTDIFAFGGILFEMLTGRRAFEGKSQAGTIAAILETDPAPLTDLADLKSALPPSAHRALDRLLRKCLAKNPDERWQSASDLADELQWIDQERLRSAGEPELVVGAAAASAASNAPAPPRARTGLRMALALLAGGLLSAAGFAGWLLLRPHPDPEPIRFNIAAPDGEPFTGGPGLLAVSPDGRQIAFVAGALAETSQLWVRSLDSLEARPLPNSMDPWQPFWSPDGRFLAFMEGRNGGGRIKKVALAGGPTLTVSDTLRSRGSWSPQGVVLLRGPNGTLLQAPENGGQPVQVTTLDAARHETGHDWPFFLPDGRRFLFLALSSDTANTSLFLASLDSKERTHLVDVQSSVEYASGYLLYVRAGTLMAHPFDEKQGRLTGDPLPLAENVMFNAGNGRAAFSVSTSGVLAYLSGAFAGSGTLTWYESDGRTTGTTGAESNYTTLRISPNGRYLAAAKTDSGGRPDLWLIDMERGVPTRFTFDIGDDNYPVWSPDSSTVFFRSNRKGHFDLYRRAAGGALNEELLFESAVTKTPTGVSPDGKLLLFQGFGSADSKQDIWVLPLEGTDRKPVALIATPYNEGSAVFSPDGKWITYDSDEAGGTQTYVQPYPPNGTKVRLSTGDGRSPQWSQDGQRIVYSTADRHLMSVDVKVVAGELRPGVPRELFSLPFSGDARNFATDAQARRFLVPTPKKVETAQPITVVLNWTTLLKKK